MLKRILFTAAFCLSLVAINAMTIDETIAKLSKAKNADVKKIDGSLTSHLKSGKIDSLVVINFEKCDESIKKEFDNIYSKDPDPSYEMLVKTSEDDEKTLILTQNDGQGKYKSMVIFTMDGDEFTIVKIMGNISPSEMPSILK